MTTDRASRLQAGDVLVHDGEEGWSNCGLAIIVMFPADKRWEGDDSVNIMYWTGAVHPRLKESLDGSYSPVRDMIHDS